MASRLRKARAKPVGDVSSEAYVEQLSLWLWEGPTRTIEFRVGKWVSDARAVSPASMERIHSVMQRFITAGHVTGVLLTKRLEQAVCQLLVLHPEYTETPKAAEVVGHKLTNHLMFHFTMLRDLKAGKYK